MSFEIGDRVRWHPRICVSDWVATVIDHPAPRMVLLDSGPTVSVGLLELVDRMDDVDRRFEAHEAARAAARIAELEAERDALAEVVAMQMMLVTPSPPGDKEREWGEKLVRLMNYHFEAIYQNKHWRAMMKADSPLTQLVALIDRGPM